MPGSARHPTIYTIALDGGNAIPYYRLKIFRQYLKSSLPMNSSPTKYYSLFAGQTFSSYASLCSYLEEDIRTGGSKMAQLKLWGTLFNWTKQGHTLIISADASLFKDDSLPTARKKISKLNALPGAELGDKEIVPYPVLIEGQVFNTYPELCSFLGEKVSSGCSKKAQLERWEVFFSSKREGHKFIITEVLRPWEPFDLDWRYSGFAGACRLLITHFLQSVEELEWKDGMKEAMFYQKDLYPILGFHGEGWKLLEKDSAWQIEKDADFHRTVREAVELGGKEVFRKELHYLLDMLDRKNLLEIRKTYLIEAQKSTFRFATQQEELLIGSAKKEALLRLEGRKREKNLTEYKVHTKGMGKEYYQEVRSLLAPAKLGAFCPVLRLAARETMVEELRRLSFDLARKEDQRKKYNEHIVPKVERRSETTLTRLRGVPGTDEDLEWMKEIIAVAITL